MVPVHMYSTDEVGDPLLVPLLPGPYPSPRPTTTVALCHGTHGPTSSNFAILVPRYPSSLVHLYTCATRVLSHTHSVSGEYPGYVMAGRRVLRIPAITKFSTQPPRCHGYGFR
eukprot:3399363-Rhodomonas_salina.1